MKSILKVGLNDSQMGVLSTYMSEATGNGMPTVKEMEKEVQDIVDRAIRDYADTLGVVVDVVHEDGTPRLR